ncbi:histone deacetylase [candidate division KSB1 bacterium]|nr:histone deacetylase [candidate division KSB1 bacterium]
MKTQMHRTGYIFDPIFQHHNLANHPENASRLESILKYLEMTKILAELHPITSRMATREELLLVHSADYLSEVEEKSRQSEYLDPDTYTTPDSYLAAATAAGSLIALANAVLSGEVKNGFALLRPPGHHALPNQGMGFCIFNNEAIAAKVALQWPGVKRIAIIDFDVHHGNGTQAIFETDPNVLYISSHSFPFYPGTGNMNEIGSGDGKGTTVNLPLSERSGDSIFKKVYSEIVIPVIKRFKPDFIFINAGYDAHFKDPLGNLGLSLSGYSWLSQLLVDLASEVCQGKIIFSLNGGYNLDVIKIAVANTIKILLGRSDMEDPFGSSPFPEPANSINAEYMPLLKKLHNLD